MDSYNICCVIYRELIVLLHFCRLQVELIQYRRSCLFSEQKLVLFINEHYFAPKSFVTVSEKLQPSRTN